MITLGKRLKISIFTLALLVGAYFLDYLYLYLTAFTFAALHELAHVGAAFLLRVPIERIEIQPFGICAKLKENYIKEPYKEILIALAGPIFNFIIAALCYVLLRLHNIELKYINYILLLNLSMGIINLLPCLPLDGGRVVKALLTNHWGIIKAFNTVVRLTQAITVVILAAAAFLLLYSEFNFSLILIGAFLLANISAERRNINIIAMKEMLKNKEKLKKDDINKVRTIAVFADVPARILLKYFSYNYYYIIDILDKNMTIINRITESQLIDALVQKGVRVRVRDI